LAIALPRLAAALVGWPCWVVMPCDAPFTPARHGPIESLWGQVARRRDRAWRATVPA
jgi:hypothetical protein